MLPALVFLLALPMDGTTTFHASDAAPLIDGLRPVSRITKNSFTLQYWTNTPCETRVEIRQSNIPRVAYKHALDGAVKMVQGPAEKQQWHIFSVTGLNSGRRYYYRIWDPGAQPTPEEKKWGAGDGWRREYAVSTEAPRGYKTIIHIPVKVLLMPNVVNVESAYADTDDPAPAPPPMTADQIQKIKDEYAVSSRVFWVASGMRLWVDYQFFIDGRLQRWGPEPKEAVGAFKGLPQCRSYADKDFVPPGGGGFTIVDTKDPSHVTADPVVEDKPFAGQIEEAFPRRWNLRLNQWEFYESGGGTLGVDDYPNGIPGRTQFLGGSDTAWLATHEFHHDLESQGQFSLSDREDDRIVFDHPSTRHRYVRGDGSVDETTWNTSGRHGEQWDVIAYWDRQISDCQWLRMYFGDTMTVKDADEDGFPDDDPRLPLDEKRFGSSPKSKATDGVTPDLQKVMESNWAPGPLQSSWTKPPFQGLIPNPTKPDSYEGDPYPLSPNLPLIVPEHMEIDGNPSKWAGVPVAGSVDRGGVRCTFKEAHDEYAYYGQYELHGPWKRVDAVFDGEGNGLFGGTGVLGFQTTLADVGAGGAGPEGPLVATHPTFGGAPGLKIEARKLDDGGMAVEFSLPNRGLGPWYWKGGGHEIGVELNVWDVDGHGYSMWQPYQVFYARMIEPNGEAVMPSDAPEEIGNGPNVQAFRPGDPKLKAEAGWTVSNGVAAHTGADESALYVDGLSLHDFDLMAVVEGKHDAVLAAFTKAMRKMDAEQGYVGFVGGYDNSESRLRIFGIESGTSAQDMTPGQHRVQLSRRGGEVWLLFDGKAIAYAVDPNPRAVLDRVAVLGGFGDQQVVHEIRLVVH